MDSTTKSKHEGSSGPLWHDKIAGSMQSQLQLKRHATSTIAANRLMLLQWDMFTHVL